MGLTKQVLRRPVTTVLVVLCLIVFGLSSVFSSKLELTPEMEMPMLIVNAVYPGASPEDVEELVTKPIEDEISTLTGIDTITSMSSENMGMVLLQYEYGKDMDKAYERLPWRSTTSRRITFTTMWTAGSFRSLRSCPLWPA